MPERVGSHFQEVKFREQSSLQGLLGFRIDQVFIKEDLKHF